MAKILVVEDDSEILNSVRKILESEHHTVETASDGKDGWHFMTVYDYDLIVLDWQLPDKQGLDIMRDYRSNGGGTPILMLTGRTSISDKEQGLDTGADDYLTKPFAGRELSARVRALLRRPAQAVENVLSVGGLVLDPVKYSVTKNGQHVDLQPREFQLLEFFMRNPNRVFEQDAVLNRVWKSDSEATTEALRSAIRRLRQKVDPEGQLLQTVYGVGFVFRSRD
jgi:DNA-binding response OmpR family regulator